ncbi:hypothetical protein IQ243_13375 [Nostocales cyanobacterium LEGE 11386]|nr:hypothetical protein [Nostocales cyanobacterium LEGE 11386]
MGVAYFWDGHLARPLYFRAGKMPTLQESSLDSAAFFAGISTKTYVFRSIAVTVMYYLSEIDINQIGEIILIFAKKLIVSNSEYYLLCQVVTQLHISLCIAAN